MRLIAGRAKSGKSTMVYDEIASNVTIGSDLNCILIVPDTMTFQAENDLISRFEQSGIMNVRILTFKRFVQAILEEQGKTNLNDITNFGKIMILRKVLEQCKDRLGVYARVSNQQGLLIEIERVVGELKESCISPVDMEKVISNSNRPVTVDKIKDIGIIYEEYINATRDKYYDSEDKTDLAIDLMEKSKLVKESRVWIDGFENFSRKELKLIEGIERTSKSLTISLNMDPNYIENPQNEEDWEVFKIVRDTYNDLAEISIGDFEIFPSQVNAEISEEIRSLEKNMFCIDHEIFDGEVENIKVFTAINPYNEVEKTAATIKRIVRDGDHRYRDIKIAVNDKGAYKLAIKKVFERDGIPYFSDDKKDVLSTPLVRTLVSLLDMFNGGFRAEDVFRYIKSGYSNISGTEAEILENTALEYGIDGGKWFEKLDELVPDFIEAIRSKFACEFETKKSEFKKMFTVGDYTVFLLEYINRLDIQNRVRKRVAFLTDNERYHEASELSQSWNSIMEVMEQMVLLGGEDKVSAMQYKGILETGLKEVGIRTIPQAIDSVEIGNMKNISVKGTKVLFIMGFNEGSVIDIKEKGILADDDRREFIHCDVKINSGSEFNISRDSHVLYKLLSVPSEKLYISYSLGSDDDKSLQPSLYMSTLKSIYKDIKEDAALDSHDIDMASSIEIAKDHLSMSLRNYLKSDDISPLWREVYRWFEKNEKEKLEEIIRNLEHSNHPRTLGFDAIKDRFDNNLTMTVTKLERYAECPFKYFAENILSPKERKVQEVEFYDIGNDYHDIIEEFIKGIIEDEDKIDSMDNADAEERMKKSIKKVRSENRIRNLAFESSKRNSYIQKKMDRVLLVAAKVLLLHIKKGDFRPKFTELQIGNVDKNRDHDEKIEPLEIRLNDATVNLVGKIDRVDTFLSPDGEIYFRIIDYKSKDKSIELKDLYEGLQLQLLVYLLAFYRNGDKLVGKKPRIAGVYYFAVDDPLIKLSDHKKGNSLYNELRLNGYSNSDMDILEAMDRDIKSGSDVLRIRVTKDNKVHSGDKGIIEEDFITILDFVETKATKLSESIFKGEFPITPFKKKGDDTACKYCDYGSVCMFDTTAGDSYKNIKPVPNNHKQFLEFIKTEGGKVND